MKKLINNETEIAAKVHNTLDNVSLNKNYSEATSPNVSQVTTKEIYPGIFMAPINLPRNPLRSINNYIVKGQSRDLMVDTAFNNQSCVKDINCHMDYCKTKATSLDIFFTHLHSDHTGLANYFADRGSDLYMGRYDANYVNNSLAADSPVWLSQLELALYQGLAADDLKLEEHPGFRYRPQKRMQVNYTAPGDVFKIGSYSFTVIDLPGHTPGLQALYEPEHQLLFCGDHILGDITPNITFWDFAVGDSLGTYFKSLELVETLPIRYLFSAHRSLVEDVSKRITELFVHHRKRLQEARDCLRRYGPSTVRRVTQNLHWDIRAKDWSDFPNSQKWFAAGEAMAHLEHLVALGDVVRHTADDGVYYYELI
ncbi:MAG: MBL fold metallo-hydrolase [Fastidiosipilaceae bacterium]|jgi:glyoxylase-like metal-dependent hydrolase (beta-lactamase superfamily II)